jgi:hypothetical protein
MTDAPFVLTKPGIEAGEALADIVTRKEAERVVGKNIFWWGIGSSLGSAVCKAAQDVGGKLPVVFALNNRPSRPKEHDISPSRVLVWGDDGARATGSSRLYVSGSGRWPRRSQVRGQLRHDPIATAG